MTGEAGSPEAIKRWLKEEAFRQGFDRAGLTTPEPPPHLGTFTAWLEAGRHGEMRYLATERGRQGRAEPRSLLPGCKSILVLAANYLPPPAELQPGRIAAYARGDDYHDVLASRAQRTVDRLEQTLGQPIAARIYTDTGPLLEREFAQRAGLGWIGKNTCLIIPDLGSMTLLAEVLLDLDLPADPPFAPDRCGSCRRCIDACPTQCILSDRTIDAQRCVAYWTIESRQAVPRDLRRSIGDRLFGCDACQEVCPWNRRHGRPTSDPAFAPRPALNPPNLSILLTSAEGGAATFLRGSPLKRAGRSGLARNAAIVAGNLRSGEHLAALGQALLSDADPLVRGHAAWALGEHAALAARETLLRAHSQETDPGVQDEIAAALDGPRRASSG